MLPVWKTMCADGFDAMKIIRILRGLSNRVFALESTHRSPQTGEVEWDRYSYFGFNPSMEISCADGIITVATPSTACTVKGEDPVAFLRDMIDRNQAPRLPGLPPFFGGFAGYFSYEYIQYIEPTLQWTAENKERFRDYDLMFLDRVFALDRETNEILLITFVQTDRMEESYLQAQQVLTEMERVLKEGQDTAVQPLRLKSDFYPMFAVPDYLDMVTQAQSYIASGEVSQIVLTNGRIAQAEGSLVGTYAVLRQSDPTSYMCYFSSDDLEAAMASPEPIAQLNNGVIMTERLAGSYARGITKEEDDALAQQLLSDPKAIAEHNMLLDDARNEFGYISKFGTVRYEGYLNVVRCSTVMHLGTTITGELRDGVSALDAVGSISPSGAASGSPKLRACEVINRIEGNRRGIYGATVGYIGLDGNADFFVFIHSAYLRNGEVCVRTGGGIVIDSKPEEELEESFFKAAAMVNALCKAEEE